ncbi:hypothetical protein TRFO_15672 [Tritrichomonas foetus]|uniref:Uncharacterized protein n=1 Tax=Tritrichomonas foetus TaxID=1144522 RepID=A0A1J4KSD9_9EUKA|nr:hypothetical protein TRFO_15672 [Tritrichomonas foetus]|eukprot:OHT14018.1 hypothetical protein TRFO_15672 [Tritrichomonas foetus]
MRGSIPHSRLKHRFRNYTSNISDQYSTTSHSIRSKSQVQNYNFPQIFPGLDHSREVQLRKFLFTPIDSRTPFEDPVEERKSHRLPTRLNEPTPEIKDEWSQRMERIRRRKEHSDKPFAVEASLPEREQIREMIELNSLNQLPVEEVVDARDLRVHGPMNMRSNSRLPKLRCVTNEILYNSIGSRRTTL